MSKKAASIIPYMKSPFRLPRAILDELKATVCSAYWSYRKRKGKSKKCREAAAIFTAAQERLSRQERYGDLDSLEALVHRKITHQQYRKS